MILSLGPFGFSTYSIVSFMKNDHFFPILVSFFIGNREGAFIAVARTSSKVLNRSDSGHPFLVADLSQRF